MRDQALTDRMEELGLIRVARYVARGLGGDETSWRDDPCKGCGYTSRLAEGPRPLAPHDRDCPVARFVEQFGDTQAIIDQANAFANWMAQVDRSPDAERFGVVQMVRRMMHNQPSEPTP